MIAGPLPFRGPPPGRDAWVPGQSIPFNPAKWREQLPSPAWWPPELDASRCLAALGGLGLTGAPSSKLPSRPQSGGINLSVAFRTRQPRYCDTGDVAAAVPGIRVAMLGELLGIMVWQPAEADHLGALSPSPAPAVHLASARPVHPTLVPAAHARSAPAAPPGPAPAAQPSPAPVQARTAPGPEG